MAGEAFAGRLASGFEVRKHRQVTAPVHEAGGKIALQILHTGRYAYHPLAVALRIEISH